MWLNKNVEEYEPIFHRKRFSHCGLEIRFIFHLYTDMAVGLD